MKRLKSLLIGLFCLVATLPIIYTNNVYATDGYTITNSTNSITITKNDGSPFTQEEIEVTWTSSSYSNGYRESNVPLTSAFPCKVTVTDGNGVELGSVSKTPTDMPFAEAWPYRLLPPGNYCVGCNDGGTWDSRGFKNYAIYIWCSSTDIIPLKTTTSNSITITNHIPLAGVPNGTLSFRLLNPEFNANSYVQSNGNLMFVEFIHHLSTYSGCIVDTPTAKAMGFLLLRPLHCHKDFSFT